MLTVVVPGHPRLSTRMGNALLMSNKMLSFGGSTLPLLHASLYLQEVGLVSVEVEVAPAGRRLRLEPHEPDPV